MSTVTVVNNLPTRLCLRVFETITDNYDQGDVQHRELRPVPVFGLGDVILAANGTTEVDENFWNAWVVQHQDSDLVKRGVVQQVS